MNVIFAFIALAVVGFFVLLRLIPLWLMFFFLGLIVGRLLKDGD